MPGGILPVHSQYDVGCGGLRVPREGQPTFSAAIARRAHRMIREQKMAISGLLVPALIWWFAYLGVNLNI